MTKIYIKVLSCDSRCFFEAEQPVGTWQSCAAAYYASETQRIARGLVQSCGCCRIGKSAVLDVDYKAIYEVQENRWSS